MKGKILLSKAIFSTIMLLGQYVGVSAQDNKVEVKSFEFEIKAGTTYPLEKQVGNKKLGPDIGLEARWNLNNIPLDLGVEMNISTAVSGLHGDDNSNRMFSLAAVMDYNFYRGQKASPFVGVGIGKANCDVTTGWYDREGTRFMLMPRVGLELFHHVRFTFDTRIAMKKYNTVGFTVGYVFGGGLK